MGTMASTSHADESPDSSQIWRYMSFDKFVALAFSKRLWFPKLAELWSADPWEGFGRAKGLPRPSRLLKVKSVYPADAAQFLYAEFSGIAADTLRTAHKHVYANSWCLGKESLGMWDRYGAGGRGVAVVSTVGQFKASLIREIRPEQYRFGNVSYHLDVARIRHDFTKGRIPASAKLWQLALQAGFNKRDYYSDEREWRAAIFQETLRPRDRGLSEEVHLDQLIQSVRMGPRAEFPTVEAVRAVMARANLDAPLEMSSILNRPRVRRSR